MTSKNSKTTKKVTKSTNKKTKQSIYVPSLLNLYKKVIVPEDVKRVQLF